MRHEPVRSPRPSVMGTPACSSAERQSERKGRRHLVVPVLALLFQLVPPALLWAVSRAAYSEPRRLSETWERPVSLLVLALSAGVSLLLGCLGVYGLLLRARRSVAVVLIVVCCLP